MTPTKEGDTSTQETTADVNAYSLAQNRARRQKNEKKGKLSAFEKLRQAKEKGLKNKYEIEEEKSVYEEVDEGEYSELVRQRQEDDWIVDDDGAGYVEDGREIFDDDMDDEAPSKSKGKQESKKKNRNIVRPGTKPKQDIVSMFANVAATTKRKSEKDTSIVKDDILDDLLGQLNKSSSSKPVVKLGKPQEKLPKKPAHNPFKTSTQVTPKSSPIIQKAIKRELSFPKEDVPLKKSYVAEVKMEIEEEDIIVGQDIETIPDVDLSGIDFDVDFPETKQSPVKVKGEIVTVNHKPLISEELLNVGWDNVTDQSEAPADVQVDSSQLPLVENSEGEQVLRFYWLDAHEDSFHQPGVVYLFGKVFIESAKSYVSCCVVVRNIERRLFILPRVKRVNLSTNQELSEDITMPMVYEEFNKIAEKNKIDQFRSMKVRKNYAFDKLDVPVEAEYLEVRYAADLPALPSDLKGETFSHVFGTKTSSLEHLLLNQKMKGPAWLDLKRPQLPKVATSWCKLEAVISRPGDVVVSSISSPPPPLVVMSLKIQTCAADKKQNEIVAVAALVHYDFYMDRPAPKPSFQQHFCVISKPSDVIYPYDFRDQVKKVGNNMKIEIMTGERTLLAFLLAKIQKIDPDLIIGHDFYGYDLDLLLHRISVHKVPQWSKISRLKRTQMPKALKMHGRTTLVDRSSLSGRMLCDIQISAKELIRCRSYDLTELTGTVLKKNREVVELEDVKDMFLSSQQLLKLIKLSLMDSNFILDIMYELNVIPLALQITSICGNIMARTLMGGRSERNEWLLLHAFHMKDYICPDKEFKKKQAPVIVDEDNEEDQGALKKAANGRRKPAYTGGLVLEPKKGFYDTYILLLDFNSLYPSIIQEYNICFTTISRTPDSPGENIEDDETNLVLPDPDLEPGVLPTEIRKLVESRKQVKTLMKEQNITSEQMMQYDIRQKALKLTANSMYGCLGFSFSRFYAKPLAALVTGKGREILLKTKDLVQSMNLDVIYGDTDSIMINTNITSSDNTTIKEVYKIGNKVKNEVNKLYRLLEIDIDGVFKSMLLLKKKKYAALTVTVEADGKEKLTQEMKGLDIVRRDWCDLAKDAGTFVVAQILSGQSRETIVDNIHNYLQTTGEKVRNGKLETHQYYITKQLTKNPEDYPDKKSLPHVQVALRYNTKSAKQLRQGDTVPYVICEDGSTLSATQRAYHPEELAKQENLKLDTKYYLAHQIHPVIARLCDPIEGTDSARIAECLGLDPSGYRHTSRQEEVEVEDMVTIQLTTEERFRDCDRLVFPCPSPKCGRLVTIDSVFVGSDSSIAPSLWACPNPECKTQLWKSKVQLMNLLHRKIQQHVNKYYQGWLKCEDTGCGARTNKLPLIMHQNHPVCPVCDRGYLHVEYTDSALYNQLCFYDYIFDIPKAMTFLNEGEKLAARRFPSELIEVYREIKIKTSRWLDMSDYCNVDLGKLFQGLGLAKVKMEAEI
ncbi:DNA polymerase alpha catalytic subunit-like [Physella acuta]|uniref:DNA polymerase alpha catalytic subunit-like n=1 Tax=Physella acuta TaxID=109671 RepID=UPI0027DDA438|nr:DNA polymerase alpha catalytic subunit-like [Physella acuta]